MKFYSKYGKEIDLLSKDEIATSTFVQQLYFGTNTTVEIPLKYQRGVILVGLTLNGASGFIFDALFINDYAIKNIKHLADDKITYKIENNKLIITCNINWSIGFYITHI